MRIKLAAAALMAAVFLTGCQTHGTKTNPIQAGKVVGKSYMPAFEEMVQIEGSSLPPVPETHPECWSIAFTAKDDWNFKCVSKDVYDHTNLGDWYGN